MIFPHYFCPYNALPPLSFLTMGENKTFFLALIHYEIGREIMPYRRMVSTHPDYEKLNGLFNDLNVATNPQMFFAGEEIVDEATGLLVARPYWDVPEVERLAIIDRIKDLIDVELESGRFADWINQNPLFDKPL